MELRFSPPDLFALLTRSLPSILPISNPKPKPKPESESPIQEKQLVPDLDFRRDRNRILFRPYVARVPWHGGPRAFLSQLFPRYGHYCGPNWSSGKDGGSMLWDLRPIDWLDFCCYCHDIGYDTADQAKLLQADLAFLDCLQKPRTTPTRGDTRIAHLYMTMCVTGLKNILIPYRMQLVRLQSGVRTPSFAEVLGNLFGWRGEQVIASRLNDRLIGYSSSQDCLVACNLSVLMTIGSQGSTFVDENQWVFENFPQDNVR